MGVNVGQILRQAAALWPERTGVIDLGASASAARREVSFAALDAQARAIAARLSQRGLRPGQTVALIGENSAEFVAAWFAIAYAGCSVVPIPILSVASELRFRIEHARCHLILFDAARRALVDEVVASLAQPPACVDYIEAAHGEPGPSAPIADTAPADTAMLLYTSGTTGSPKGAAISHSALTLHTAILAQHALHLGEQDRVLGVLPLTHSYGCRMVMLATFFAGARCVLTSRFDAARSLGLIAAEGITWFPAVPTMFAAWAAQPGEPAFPALRWALSAGAPLADETCRRAEQRLGVEIRQGYGLTEATFCTMNAPPDRRVLGSVGKPVWGVEVRVVDADGRDAHAGVPGEVVARGHNTMTGYLHDPEATAAAWRDGFLHSGDVGRFDAEGHLFLVDRLKDMIIRGGYNVYPSEVEAVFAEHPDVHDVAVIGVADAYYGEEVIAVVIARAGAQLDAAQLLRWAAPRVGKTKAPRAVAFVEAFPLGPSGKVLKRTLREWVERGRVAAHGADPRKSGA
jgi:long-chain acyl-CoA synthetase